MGASRPCCSPSLQCTGYCFHGKIVEAFPTECFNKKG
uniref:Uncharacterized protein n=1 Tax=Arundo donax TaxID=35708 RepID=A0A0A9HTR2_ARUDO